MIITISGKPGSGKSTIAQRLADALHYRRYYMGDIRRRMAAEHGLTLAELNAIGEREDWTDRSVEATVERLGRTEDNFVIESRTAFHFIPQSVKIFLDVSEAEGARRIFAHLKTAALERNEARNINSPEDMERLNRERMASDARRYPQYYHFDPFDRSRFDIWLDTTKLTPDQVLEKLLSFIKSRQAEAGPT